MTIACPNLGSNRHLLHLGRVGPGEQSPRSRQEQMEMRLETGLSPAEDGVDVPGLSWNGVLGHGQECGKRFQGKLGRDISIYLCLGDHDTVCYFLYIS